MLVELSYKSRNKELPASQVCLICSFPTPLIPRANHNPDFYGIYFLTFLYSFITKCAALNNIA